MEGVLGQEKKIGNIGRQREGKKKGNAGRTAEEKENVWQCRPRVYTGSHRFWSADTMSKDNFLIHIDIRACALK